MFRSSADPYELIHDPKRSYIMLYHQNHAKSKVCITLYYAFYYQNISSRTPGQARYRSSRPSGHVVPCQADLQPPIGATKNWNDTTNVVVPSLWGSSKSRVAARNITTDRWPNAAVNSNYTWPSDLGRPPKVKIAKFCWKKTRKYVQILKLVTIACALHVLHIVAHPTSNKKYLKNWKMFNMRQGFQKEGAIKPFIKTFCDILAFRHLTLNASPQRTWTSTGSPLAASIWPGAIFVKSLHQFFLLQHSWIMNSAFSETSSVGGRKRLALMFSFAFLQLSLTVYIWTSQYCQPHPCMVLTSSNQCCNSWATGRGTHFTGMMLQVFLCRMGQNVFFHIFGEDEHP